MSTMLNAARAYAAAGWAVFPLSPGLKIPSHLGGVNSATTDPVTISNWWTEAPESNIGIALLKSGLGCIDVDTKPAKAGAQPRDGRALMRAHIEKIGPPGQCAVQQSASKGGLHFVYRRPDGDLYDITGAHADHPDWYGIDCLTKPHRYIVAAPSVVGGQKYQWLNGNPLVRAGSLTDAWVARVRKGGQAKGAQGEALTGVDAMLADLVGGANGKALRAASKPGTDSLVEVSGVLGVTMGEVDEILAVLDPAMGRDDGWLNVIWGAAAQWAGKEAEPEVIAKLEAWSARSTKPGQYKPGEVAIRWQEHISRGLATSPKTGKIVKWLTVRKMAREKGWAPCSESVLARTEAFLGRKISECNTGHAEIVMNVYKRLKDLGLACDATGAFRRASSWVIVNERVEDFCEAVTVDMWRDAPVDSGKVDKTATRIIKVEAAQRRQEILSEFLNRPSTPAGDAELRKWVRALTGQEDPTDIAAMRHFVWQVKTKQSSRPVHDHLMVVLVGKTGGGKTNAVWELLKPWAELALNKVEAAMLTDDRSRPMLAQKAIGFVDEMAGLRKADAEELKAVITAKEISYRPMRSNEQRTLPMLMTFIASSNKGVSEIIHDTTGARRYYEMKCLDKADWDLVNSIDYSLLWEAVSELDEAPSLSAREMFKEAQKDLVWRDAVQRWLDDETFDECISIIDHRVIPSGNPLEGISTLDLYSRFASWCRQHGERDFGSGVFGKRLIYLGWEQFRSGRNDSSSLMGPRKYRCRTWGLE